MTKGTPHQVFIADATRAMLAHAPSDLLYIDELDVSGREARVKVLSLLDEGAHHSQARQGLVPRLSSPARALAPAR
jgi:hypothetical protein